MKLSITIILITFSLITFGQERVTKTKAVIGTSVISQIKTSTGWMLNSDEEWLSLKNTIPVSIASEYKSLVSYEKRGLGTDNFIYYQLRELTYKENSYYIIIKKYRDGYYTYKSIEEDWNELTSYKAYILQKDEFNKLDSLKDGQVNIIKLEIVDEIDIMWKSEKELFSLITTKINWENKTAKNTNLIFHIAPYKEKDIVQFQIYTVNNSYSFSMVGGIIKEYKTQDDKESWKSKSVYFTNELFKHCYYETNYNTFNSFIKISK